MGDFVGDTDHTTHHDDCGCLRKSIADMLRKERDRLEEIAATYRRSGGNMGHQMSIRANAFDHAAMMVEEMP